LLKQRSAMASNEFALPSPYPKGHRALPLSSLPGPYWVSRSPTEFRALLASRQVTVLNQTPSAFTQLTAADQARLAPLPLRLVVFGGEAVDPGSLRGWFDRYPETQSRLVNMFGIPETTVHMTAQTITRRRSLSRSRSVGPALPGWHLYVLDERGRPLPVGVPTNLRRW
jgi:non-ribosomal peptide synthetase component F